MEFSEELEDEAMNKDKVLLDNASKENWSKNDGNQNDTEEKSNEIKGKRLGRRKRILNSISLPIGERVRRKLYIKKLMLEVNGKEERRYFWRYVKKIWGAEGEIHPIDHIVKLSLRRKYIIGKNTPDMKTWDLE